LSEDAAALAHGTKGQGASDPALHRQPVHGAGVHRFPAGIIIGTILHPIANVELLRRATAEDGIREEDIAASGIRFNEPADAWPQEIFDRTLASHVLPPGVCSQYAPVLRDDASGL